MFTERPEVRDECVREALELFKRVSVNRMLWAPASPALGAGASVSPTPSAPYAPAPYGAQYASDSSPALLVQCVAQLAAFQAFEHVVELCAAVAKSLDADDLAREYLQVADGDRQLSHLPRRAFTCKRLFFERYLPSPLHLFLSFSSTVHLTSG